MMEQDRNPEDLQTAEAFSYSWNTLPKGSIYTEAQVKEWVEPLRPELFHQHRIVELGCGNGSLLVHISSWNPASIHGVDLGDAVLSARDNLTSYAQCRWAIDQADLLTWNGDKGDIVLCIGVLHHLKNPDAGFEAVINATKPGGSFHCWVYGEEGNFFVRTVIEPIRRISTHLPRFIAKFFVALPLSIPFFIYSKCLGSLGKLARFFPMYKYMTWIAPERFRFFWHVAFDQLVTPQTQYISRARIESWLSHHRSKICQGTEYIIQRNGNSWKFGGKLKEVS